MDDIIKLLQELMTRGPKPKGGIADTAEGVEFLGKQLTKEQRGSLMIVNSRLTDASQFQPFSIASVGKDKRFKLISDYEKDLSNEFNKTIEFLKEKSITEDGKKPSNVLDMEGNVLDPNEPIIGGTQDTVTKFRLNVDRFQKDFNISDEELQKILALPPEEQQKIVREYIDKDFKERIELSDFDVTDKEPNAQGGIVGLRI